MLHPLRFIYQSLGHMNSFKGAVVNNPARCGRSLEIQLDFFRVFELFDGCEIIH